MMTRIEVCNFKGFRSVSISPARVNLLIGANGTGKTTFADLLDFVSIACRFGLKAALERYGGLDEVRSRLPAQGRRPSLECTFEVDGEPYRGIDSLKYSFALEASKDLIVNSESLKATLFRKSPGRPGRGEKVKYARDSKVEIEIVRQKNRILQWRADALENPIEFDDAENLILNAYGKLNPFQTVADYFGAMRVYNIDAVVAKTSHNGGDGELERNGSNLIPFVKRIIESEGLRDELIGDIRNAIPYIGTITPERILSYTTLKFSERDSNLEFRAQQMSDGTIRMLGLLAVLRQSPPLPVVVIEEPENALHSYAIRSLVRIAREVSRDERFPTQVFFTSHSPAVVDEVLSLESISEVDTKGFVTRRRGGANTIEEAPSNVVRGISQNLGRPSDFLREGTFDDGPAQLELFDTPQELLK